MNLLKTITNENNTSFEKLRTTYLDATRALVKGGADYILIETVFDTLNAKAAIFAVEQYRDESGDDIPVMISGTITDASGRTLSGQTPEAFWNAVRHVRPLAVGLNCALGAKHLRRFGHDPLQKTRKIEFLIDFRDQADELHLLLAELLCAFDEMQTAECDCGLRGHIL